VYVADPSLKGDGQIGGLPAGHVHRPLHETVADGRSRQVNFARKDVWQDECAVLARLDGRPALDGYEHLGKRYSRPGVDDDSLDGRPVGRADRILRPGIPGQRQQNDDQFRNCLHDSVGSSVEVLRNSARICQRMRPFRPVHRLLYTVVQAA
jgi:hypothetical protein